TRWDWPRRPKRRASVRCCDRSASATAPPTTTRCDWPPPTGTCSTMSTATSNRPRTRRIRMALTGDAKEELSHLEVNRPSARKAEAAAILRFAGGLHLVGGRVVVEAELDAAAVARRL